MTSMIVIFVCIFLGLGLMHWSIRRSLAQRESARRYRSIFIAAADDLLGKSEIPDVLAQHIVMGARLPAGWISRFMVVRLVFRFALGKRFRRPNSEALAFAAAFAGLPRGLKERYAVALLSLAISDSYRSSFFGAVWRAINGWTLEAVKDVGPDVNGHATKNIVVQVADTRPPVWSRSPAQDCLV